MQRYFVPAVNWDENQIIVTGDDVHHINRVMRFHEQDSIICNHPDGRAAVCTIVKQTADTVTADIETWLDENVELPVQVTIAQGLPKGDKLDFVLQKGTELGATGFIPVQTDRSVVIWDKKKSIKKQERHKKIVKEASEQSHRNHIPNIHPLVHTNEFVRENHPYDVLLFAYEEEAKSSEYSSFAEHLKQLKSGQSILVFIGPEGGFSKKEADALQENGFMPVRLGPRILRAETAALYVLSCVSYHLEELRCTSCQQ